MSDSQSEESTQTEAPHPSTKCNFKRFDTVEFINKEDEEVFGVNSPFGIDEINYVDGFVKPLDSEVQIPCDRVRLVSSSKDFNYEGEGPNDERQK